MPDYKEMYYTLFNETAKAISILQDAQQKTEEMYLAAPEDVICSISQSASPQPACPSSRLS